MRFIWLLILSILVSLTQLLPLLHAAENPTITFSSLLKDAVSVETIFIPRAGFPGVWSSYDRSGGSLDDQGYIRKEGESFVIAEMMGPGAITRIWVKQPKGSLEIYVDDGGKPVLSLSTTDLFQGKLSPFISPWVYGKKNDSGYSFIPIPYNRFCKIVTSELFEYEIDYLTYPSQTIVEPFKIPVPKAHQTTLTAVSKIMQTNGKPPYQVGKDFVEAPYAFTIPAGESVEFATFTGPAIIKGIQIQWDKQEINYGRDLVLSLYWDHQSEPSVQVPLYDFFGCGSNNWLIGINENNEGYCFFPMPYLQEARLAVRNDNLKEDISVHISVSLQLAKKIEEPLRRFHAGWHYSPAEQKTMPVTFDMQRKTPITDSTQSVPLLKNNATGHLAGISISQIDSIPSDLQLLTYSGMREIRLNSSGINGFLNTTMAEKPPAFSFSGTSSTPTFSASRLFLPTPVSMEEKTELMMENGQGNMVKQTVSAVLYWYQEDQSQPYSNLPSYLARHFRQTVIRKPQYVVEHDRLIPLPVQEAELAELEVSGGVYEPQDMSAYGPDWSQNQQIRFEAFQEEAELAIKLPDVQYSGWYQLKGVFTESPDGGIIAVKYQDNIIDHSLDLYAESIQPKTYNCPTKIFIHAGETVDISVIMKGMNSESSGFNAGIDYLELHPQSWNPQELTVTGPLVLEPTDAASVLQKHTLLSSLDIMTGYAEPAKLKTLTVKLNPKLQGFAPDALTIDSTFTELNTAVCFQFDVKVEQSGIYRFEIEGNSTQNFTLNKSVNGFEKSSNRIWVNGIPLQAEERRYWDTDTHDFQPLRYPVPLKKGNNLIMWMMEYNPDAVIRPVFYGLEK